MTVGLGIVTFEGVWLGTDSRTIWVGAFTDTCRKMCVFDGFAYIHAGTVSQLEEFYRHITATVEEGEEFDFVQLVVEFFRGIEKPNAAEFLWTDGNTLKKVDSDGSCADFTNTCIGSGGDLAMGYSEALRKYRSGEKNILRDSIESTYEQRVDCGGEAHVMLFKRKKVS